MAMGAIIASAACAWTMQRFVPQQSPLARSEPKLRRCTFAACGAALLLCVGGVALGGSYEVMFASGSGLAAFICIYLVRRFGLRAWGTAGAAVVLGIAVFILAAHSVDRGMRLPLAFAISPSGSQRSLNERILADAPLVGNGAGTFTALVPIYREMNDPAPSSLGLSTATAIAVELGRPMLWLILTGAGAAAIALLWASLRRGRDAFYPLMGGSCLITIILLAFTNPGLFGTAAGSIAAITLGIGFAQSKSRSA